MHQIFNFTPASLLFAPADNNRRVEEALTTFVGADALGLDSLDGTDRLARIAGLRVALAGITANAIEAMESALEDAEAEAADAAAEAPADHAGSDSPTTADPPDGTG